MKIRFLFYLCLMLFTSTALSQAITETEFKEIETSITETYASSPTNALQLVNSLLSSDTVIFSLEQRAIITNYKAWFLLENDELEQAMKTLVHFMDIALQSSNKDLMYGYLNISGGIYARLGMYQDALHYYSDALPVAKTIGKHLLQQTEINIALINLNLKRYRDATIAFEQYRDTAKIENQPLDESFASTHLAIALIGLGDFDHALDVLNDAIILQQRHGFTAHLSKSFVLKGKVLRLKGMLNESEEFLTDAVELIKTQAYSGDYLSVVLCLAQTYDAQDSANKALNLLASIETDTFKLSDITTQLEVTKLTAQLLEKQEQYAEALIAYKHYAQINAEILKRQANVNLAKALAQADAKAKELKIAELTRAEQVKATKAQAFKDLTIVISICLVIILFGSFIAINNIDKRKQELEKILIQLNETQDHLIEIEKIASLTSLVSGMAHQLNTPIGTIVTASSLIDEYLESLSDKFKQQNLSSKYFHEFITNTDKAKDLVISAINRLAGIVEEFKALNVSINLDKPLSSIPLKNFIHHKLEPMSKYLGKKITYHVDGDSVAITSCPSILEDILKTLVINSYEHGFTHTAEGKVDITIRAGNDNVKIIYQDNGVGIKESILQEIFTPFYTTNLGGHHLGLGLNVVFNAVKYNLKGNICAVPSKHGARFVITLPIDARLVDDIN
ncbi:ATP-binding protein [Pseudoalteromonas sp. APAL1]|uniref:tetratricopeptide repeat-containing sensor histidine kinase n=1 Tax=Pseudoalteromonas TaxID=53246 RepID=UPI000EEF3D92|nr:MULTISPECIES: HAMP domain-containing sensor histidine kinase [unclassified Pseudoalteromonas]MCF2920593.1 ATP-binding protein [Pseudoalteromonas sp. APAL1]HCV05550.1 hypothetical protein [Pseudoalteromonas sp.]|tara:strand:+ start:1542 stop:3578 length:2037 start_codon:yes stop_codon:yes gene_type:complete